MDGIRTILAGGSPLLQAGIAAALEHHERLRVVGRLRDAGAVVRTDRLDCDVLVLTSDIPHIEAAPIVEKLAATPRAFRLLVLTDNEEGEEALATLRLGVRGYGICAELGTEDLCEAVLTLARRGTWLCARTTELLINLVLRATFEERRLPDSVLSPREFQVLCLFYDGTPEEEIAERLSLSRNTVKTYLRRIREKLHAETRHDAVALAIEQGLLPRAWPRGLGHQSPRSPIPLRPSLALSPPVSPSGARR
ncbi:MAG TPA: response regulator transcription factor [Chloroflexota bacterium]|nr:response regulator transcription factor [Chloroflexota bacterium]